MRTVTVISVSILLTFNGKAQPTFEKFYDAGTSFRFNLTELSGQNILVGLGWARGVSRLDPLGNVLHTQYYWSDTVTGLGAIRRSGDNEFLFVAGYRKDSCSSGMTQVVDRYPLIGKMDSMGNLLAMKYYVLDQGCSNVASDAVVTNDGGMVTWGFERDFFAMKVDHNLEPQWSIYHDRPGGFQFIKELPGGDLLAGMNMDTAGAVVARLDANGNYLWCKSYIRPKGVLHDAVIGSDSSFILTGYTDSIASTNGSVPLPTNYDPKLFIMKLDGSGEVQWCKGYTSEPKWYARNGLRVVRTQNDNSMVLANIGAQNFNRPFRPFMMKVDPNGDTLWTRSAGRGGYEYSVTDLLAHSDGGFLYNGMVYGDLPGSLTGAPYIFKTDSLGHLPCWERQHPIQIVDLFPADSSFILLSGTDALALPTHMSDTIFDPITTYNGCTFTTGIPSSQRQPSTPQVRPNPNAGRFTVQFPDPLTVDSFYSVYDNQGRLLYQRPLPEGKETEEIDLSGFGKGIYLLRITNRDGVCNERVVLE